MPYLFLIGIFYYLTYENNLYNFYLYRCVFYYTLYIQSIGKGIGIYSGLFRILIASIFIKGFITFFSISYYKKSFKLSNLINCLLTGQIVVILETLKVFSTLFKSILRKISNLKFALDDIINLFDIYYMKQYYLNELNFY